MRAAIAGCIAALLSVSDAHAIDWRYDQDIWPAAYLDVTPAGFESFQDIAATLLPPTFPIDPSLIEQSGDIDLLLVGAEYSFGVENLYVAPTIVDLQITPATDTLQVRLVMDVDVNTPSDPAVIYVTADLDLLFGLISLGNVIDERCAMDVRNARIDLTADVTVTVQKDVRGNPIFGPDGNVALDVAFNNVAFPLPPLEQEDLNLRSAPGGSCIIDDIADIADFLGLDVVEFILQELRPTLDAQVAQLIADVEPQIEDAFDQLNLATEVDLLGTTLEVSAYPRDVVVEPDGLRLELGGRFFTGDTPHPCISRFDDGTSIGTLPPSNPRYPAIGASPRPNPELGVLVNDDWLNQAAYAAWRGGLLCQVISEGQSPVDLPIPINTTLLNLLAAGQFNDLFPTAAPLEIRTRPEAAPYVSTTGATDVEILIPNLGLDFAAELDYRLTRVAGLDLTAVAGANLTFDGATGNLGAGIVFDPAAIQASVSYNELKPDASAQMETGFSALADTLVGPLLSSALQGLAFPLPSFSGVGLVSLDVDAIGVPGQLQDFLGAYATLGVVPYADPAATGCGADGGCGGTDPAAGCTGGCSASGEGRALAFSAVAALALLRRRRRA